MKPKIYMVMFVFLLLLVAVNSFAEIFSVLLANDTIEPHRKKEGDIVAIKPVNGQWGTKERKHYLIVLVDFRANIKSLNEARSLGAVPLYSDGTLTPDMEATPERIAKNRFKISFSQIDVLAKAEGITIDWDKVRNLDVDYQPLKDKGIILDWSDLLYCKYTERKLTIKDLDAVKKGERIEKKHIIAR